MKKDKPLTIYQAVKLWCANDCETNRKDAINCPNIKCRLYPFRNGNNPNRKKRIKGISQSRNGKTGKFLPLYNGEKKPRVIGLTKDGRLRIKLPSGTVMKIDLEDKKEDK